MEAGLPQAIHSAEKSYESCWNFTKTQDGKRDWYIIAGERKWPGEKERAVTHKKKSDPEQVKVLIDNILLAIKMNASMLSSGQMSYIKSKLMEIAVVIWFFQ